MRTALLACSLLLAAPLHAETVALGVSAVSPGEVIVKISGKDTHVRLAGVTGGGDAARLFLQCLIAGRVVRVQGDRVTLLDGNSVATHVNEFLQSKTEAEPCALGKAAYSSTAPHANVPPATTSAPPAAPAATSTTATTTAADSRETNLGPSPAKHRAPPRKTAAKPTPAPRRPTPAPQTATDAPGAATNTVAPTKP